MSKTVAIGSTRGYRQRRAVHRARTLVLRLPALLMYGVLGLAGVMLWMLMQLPVGARGKSALVYAMAGCVGTFTLGWQMLRAQTGDARRR